MGKTRRYNPDENWNRKPRKKSQKKMSKPESYGYHNTQYDEDYSYGTDQFQRFDRKRKRR